MTFTPNLFFAHMRGKGGPAMTCRFQVVIPIPVYVAEFIGNSLIEKIINFPNSIFNDVSQAINSAVSNLTGLGQGNTLTTGNSALTRYLSLQCEDAELPGKGLYTTDAKIYGPTFKIPYQCTYSPVTTSFICTNEFEERKLFDRWLEAIMPTDTNNMRFPKGSGESGSSYLTNIKIIQYDDSIRQIYAVELIDAFPVSVGSQRLNWGESSIHRLSVQFAYHKYKTIYDSTINVGETVSSVLGTLATKFIPQSI